VRRLKKPELGTRPLRPQPPPPPGPGWTWNENLERWLPPKATAKPPQLPRVDPDPLKHRRTWNENTESWQPPKPRKVKGGRR
jgi:hypothetical protein